MPLKDGSVSRSSKILAVEAFGNLVFFLVVVHLLMCSFFAPLTIPLHSPFLSTHHSSPLFFHFYDRSFGNSERIDIVSYYLPYSTLVFFRKRRGNFTLNYFDFFPTSSKITVHSASVNFRFLVRFAGEEGTFSDVFSRHKGHHHGNCLCGELAVG